MFYLLSPNLLNQLRFSNINTMKNILQIQRFPSLHELMQLLFSVLMEGRPISHNGIISDLGDSHVNQVQASHSFLKIP